MGKLGYINTWKHCATMKTTKLKQHSEWMNEYWQHKMKGWQKIHTVWPFYIKFKKSQNFSKSFKNRCRGSKTAKETRNVWELEKGWEWEELPIIGQCSLCCPPLGDHRCLFYNYGLKDSLYLWMLYFTIKNTIFTRFHKWKPVLPLWEFQHWTMEHNSLLWVSTVKGGEGGRKMSSEFTQHQIINKRHAATHSAEMAQPTSRKVL